MQFCCRWKHASLRQRLLKRFAVWGEIYVCVKSQPRSQTLPKMSLLWKHFSKDKNQIYCRWHSLLCRGPTQVSVLYESYLNTAPELHKSTARARKFPWKNSLSLLKRMHSITVSQAKHKSCAGLCTGVGTPCRFSPVL